MQVVHLLGEPDFTEMENGTELLHYSYREDYMPPLSDDAVHAGDLNRRMESQRIKRSLEEYRYVVKLVDGAVQDYKQVRD